MNPESRNPAGAGRDSGGQPNESCNQNYTPTRAAPYSRSILEAQRAGRHPNVYCFAGSDAWNQAEHRRRTHGEGTALVLPPGEDPEAFRWPALDALVLVPGDCDGDSVRRLDCRLPMHCRSAARSGPDLPLHARR